MRAEQNRRFARYDVEGVHGSFLFSVGVDVRNLSIAGMALETSRSLNVGRRYTFNLNAGDDTVRIPGRVVWCVLGSGRRGSAGEIRPVFQAGVHFEDVLSETAGELLHVIEESAVLDVDQRVFGRFRPTSASVSLDAGPTFTVRRISLAGMLVSLRGVGHDFACVDTAVSLELELGGERLTAGGRVAWVNGESGHGRLAGMTELGVEFGALDAGQKTLLERFITSVVTGAETAL